MKKMLLLLFPMLILVGCGKTAVPTWQPVTEGGRVYSIMIGVPSDAGQVSQSPWHSVLTVADALIETIENASAQTRTREIIFFIAFTSFSFVIFSRVSYRQAS